MSRFMDSAMNCEFLTTLVTGVGVFLSILICKTLCSKASSRRVQISTLTFLLVIVLSGLIARQFSQHVCY